MSSLQVKHFDFQEHWPEIFRGDIYDTWSACVHALSKSRGPGSMFYQYVLALSDSADKACDCNKYVELLLGD